MGDLTVVSGEEPVLRPMEEHDVPHILAIIAAHDEDDAEEAEATFSRGLEGHFAYEGPEGLLGTTGYRCDEWTDNTYWLSWTYVKETARGRGHGRTMLQQLLSIAGRAGARKLFVAVSDYQCPEEGDIYLAARRCYEALGFQRELQLPEFYDEGENKIIYGLRNDGATPQTPPTFPKALSFRGVFEMAETEDAYAVDWAPLKKWGAKGVNRDDLDKAKAAASESEARLLYLSFPTSIAQSSMKALEASGFTCIGTLEDYYAQGVDEYHFAIRC